MSVSDKKNPSTFTCFIFFYHKHYTCLVVDLRIQGSDIMAIAAMSSLSSVICGMWLDQSFCLDDDPI